MGSLSLLQEIFELNWSLLYCRQILYHQSYLGSPKVPEAQDNNLVSFTSKSFTLGLLLMGEGTPFAAMMCRAGTGG